MKAKSTKSFNAMGVIAPEAGMAMDIENATVFAQLQNMGFIESLENAVETDAPKPEPKKTQAKRATK